MTRNNYMHANVPSIEKSTDGKVDSAPQGSNAFNEMSKRLDEIELKYARKYKELSDEIERINNRLNRGVGA